MNTQFHWPNEVSTKESARRLGHIGELIVQAHLISWGLNTSKTDFDWGADLIVANGPQIQVKTSRISVDKKGYESYNFFLTKDDYYDFTKADVVVAYCFEDDWFFVIPTHYLSGKRFSINRLAVLKGEQKYQAWLYAWDVLANPHESSIYNRPRLKPPKALERWLKGRSRFPNFLIQMANRHI